MPVPRSTQPAGPLPAGTVRVWWATRRPLADLDLTPLSATERARIERLGTEPARERSALARVLLRAALADALDAAPATFAVDWSRGPVLGEPEGPAAPWLSLSHSGDRVVVALSEAAPVGVDIETADRGERLRPTVVERITTQAERAALASLEEAARARAAIQLWTYKEAILKSTREGLSVGPHTVEVDGFAGPAGQLVAHGTRPDLVGTSQLAALSLDTGYVGSLALLTPTPALAAEERSADDELLP